MKKKVLIAVFFVFFLGVVSGEIIDESNELFDLGNGKFEVVSYVGKPFIQDAKGVWKDFNQVVGFRFDDTERKFLAEWNEKSIELKPFIVRNGVKYYLKVIPAPIWNNLGFDKEINSFKPAYKFRIKLNRVVLLQEIGFDLISSSKLTEIDENYFWFKFEDVAVDFSDLLFYDFNLTYSIIKGGVEVKIIDLPNVAELDLDPTITASPPEYDRTAWYKTQSVPRRYLCNSLPGTARKVGFDLDGLNTTLNRSGFDFNILMPRNAVVEDMKLRIYINSGSASYSGRIEVRGTPTAGGGCKGFFNNCKSGTQFGGWDMGTDFPTAGNSGWSDWETLNSYSYTHLVWESPTYRFSAGLSGDTEIENGTYGDCWISFDARGQSNPEQLKITYSYRNDKGGMILLNPFQICSYGGLNDFDLIKQHSGFYVLSQSVWGKDKRGW